MSKNKLSVFHVFDKWQIHLRLTFSDVWKQLVERPLTTFKFSSSTLTFPEVFLYYIHYTNTLQSMQNLKLKSTAGNKQGCGDGVVGNRRFLGGVGLLRILGVGIFDPTQTLKVQFNYFSTWFACLFLLVWPIWPLTFLGSAKSYWGLIMFIYV